MKLIEVVGKGTIVNGALVEEEEVVVVEVVVAEVEKDSVVEVAVVCELKLVSPRQTSTL